MRIIHFNELDSTNKYIKRNINELGHMTVVVCDKQTSGIGRVSHIWESEENKNLTFSILIKEKVREDITLFIGYLVHKLLDKYHINSLIKWPNDIIVDNKKICGILVEAVWSEDVNYIIGIGINVNQEEFNNLNATSIKNEISEEINIQVLLDEFLSLFQAEFCKFNRNVIIITDYINKYSYLNNETVSFIYNNQELIGIVKNINEDGSIKIILNNHQEINLISGEVNKIRIMENK